MVSKPGPPVGTSQGSNADYEVGKIELADQQCSISGTQVLGGVQCSPSYPGSFGVKSPRLSKFMGCAKP